MMNTIGYLIIKFSELFSLLITILGFYLAYFIYFKNSIDKKNQIKKIIKSQIDALGSWVGSDGDGYAKNLTDEQKFDNANPSKLIYSTVEEPLINTSLIEGFSDIPDEIIGEITQLFYDLRRIKSIQSFRNLLISSNIDMALEIKNDIDLFLANNKDANFDGFLRSYDRKKDRNFKKFMFIKWIVNYAEALHCNIIGNKNHGARQHWEKVNDWLKESLNKENEYNFMFLSVTFFTFILTLEIFFYITSPTYFLIQSQFLIISIAFLFSLSLNKLIKNS